jgi:hypothetical protein
MQRNGSACAFIAIFTHDERMFAHGRVHHGSCTSEENAMNPHDPNPAAPPRPKPGEVPSPVRDVPPGQPTDPVFPPLHDPGVDPDPGAPAPDDSPDPQGP